MESGPLLSKEYRIYKNEKQQMGACALYIASCIIAHKLLAPKNRNLSHSK